MRALTLAAAILAIPAAIAYAQTPATTGAGQSAFVPLVGSGGGSGGTSGSSGTSGTSSSGNSSTWYIDTARNLIVLCTQNAGGTGAQAFTCNAQTIQTTQTATGAGATPQGGAGSGSSGTTGTGASGAGATGTSGGSTGGGS